MQIKPISKNYNVANNQNKSANNVQSFKAAVPEPVVSTLSNFYENVAKTNGFQKFIKGFSQSDKSFTHLLVAESVILSGFYMINTLRNDKIKKEQKPQMLINDTLTLGFSAAGSYFLDEKVTKAVDSISKKYMDKHKTFYSDIENQSVFNSGMRKIKTLVIFGIIYRYLGPVLITPLANKLSSKFFDKKKKEQEKTNNK